MIHDNSIKDLEERVEKNVLDKISLFSPYALEIYDYLKDFDPSSLPMISNPYWSYDGHFIIDRSNFHGVYYPKEKRKDGVLRIPAECCVLDYFEGLDLYHSSPLNYGIHTIIIPSTLMLHHLFFSQYINNSELYKIGRYMDDNSSVIDFFENNWSYTKQEKSNLLFGDLLLRIFLNQFQSLEYIHFKGNDYYSFENKILRNVVTNNVIIDLSDRLSLNDDIEKVKTFEDYPEIKNGQIAAFDKVLKEETKKKGLTVFEYLAKDQIAYDKFLDLNKDGEFFLFRNSFVYDKELKAWGCFPPVSGYKLSIPKECKSLEYVYQSDLLCHTHYIDFPKDFDYSSLMKFNDPDLLDAVSLYLQSGDYKVIESNKLLKSLYPVDNQKVIMKTILFDPFLIKFLDLFPYLERVFFNERDAYWSFEGVIVNKASKRIIYKTPYNESIILDKKIKLDLDELLSPALKDSCLILKDKVVDYYLGDLKKLSTNLVVYLPLKILAYCDYLDSENIIGYSEKPLDASINPIGYRFKYIGSRSPYHSLLYDRYFYVQEKAKAKKIKTVICPYNQWISVMKSFSCPKNGHRLEPVRLEILIKEKTKDMPSKILVDGYYCKDCKWYYLYKTEFKFLKQFLNDNYYVFNLFEVYGKPYAKYIPSSDEPILEIVGYDVDDKTQKERLGILKDLINHDIATYDEIASHLTTNISNASTKNKDMSSTIAKWESDLEELGKLYKAGEVN